LERVKGLAVEWRVINAADYGMPQRKGETKVIYFGLNHKNQQQSK